MDKQAEAKAGESPVWQGGEADRFIAHRLIDRETLRRFTGPNWRRWLVGVGTEWAIIGAVMTICNLFPYVWVWLIGIFVIGSRQHALGILAHEGVHFIVARSRRWNDWLSNLLTSYPLTYPVQGYRATHLEHHRWLETPRDPERAAIDLYPAEWNFPMSRKRIYWLLIRDSIGGSLKPAHDVVKYIWQVPNGNLPHIVGIAAYHGAIFAISIATGYMWTYLLLWLVPLLTVNVVCFRIRTVAEHSGIGAPEFRYALRQVDTMLTTRTTVYEPIFKFLFGPHNMAYHVEHHLFPSVPVFRLRELHDLLMRNPNYAERAHVSSGYRTLLDELTTAS